MTALLMVALLGSCAGTEPPAPAGPPPAVALPYQAIGVEPGWHLRLTESALVLDARYGETRVETAAPAAVDEDGAIVYRARTPDHEVAVEIRHRYCENAMSGKPFPDTVTVTLDGEAFDGCGGDPAALITGAPWTVTRLQGEPVAQDLAPAAQFHHDGAVTGSDGCNRYRGAYTITGMGVEISGLAVTRMSCGGAQDDIASRFHEVMRSVRAFRLDPAGRLMLEGEQGLSLVARR